MSQHIVAQHEHNILTLTINRPDTKNALNLEMYQALTGHIHEAPAAGVRVLVLCGVAGCFTSGNDLDDFAKGADVQSADNPIVQFIQAMLACPIPVVVAVDGLAVGIGTTLLMHSDLVYASPQASFRVPFVNLGLVPEFASSYLLPLLAGRLKASEWLMLGEFFSAEEALAGGLVNAVVDDPQAVAMAQAKKLAAQAPEALRRTKAMIRSPQQTQIDKVVNEEFVAFAEALQGPEFAEAAAAFFEKRPADFSSFK